MFVSKSELISLEMQEFEKIPNIQILANMFPQCCPAWLCKDEGSTFVVEGQKTKRGSLSSEVKFEGL